MQPLRKLREAGPPTSKPAAPILSESVLMHSPILIRPAKAVASSPLIERARRTNQRRVNRLSHSIEHHETLSSGEG